MAVDVESARWHLELDGRTWYFCGPGCLQAFSADPGSFVSVPASSDTGEESHRHEA
jgi:YHS domain-containing protein